MRQDLRAWVIKLKEAVVDVGSFKRPLRKCGDECRGMCCYDGVYLSEFEAAHLKQVVRTHRRFFEANAPHSTTRSVVMGEWRGRAGLKTTTQARSFSSLLPNYPSHFKDTACIFLTEDGKCALQTLTAVLGEPQWNYKPLTCIVHPIVLNFSANPPRIYLPNASTDPCMYDDYPGYVTKTRCGEVVESGPPAYQVLEQELKYLESLCGRDFYSEAAS